MSHAESAARGPDHRMVDRLLFFSDAVFAIVLTLLVLELRPPAGETDEEFAVGLAAMARHFVSFGISFALAGIFWLAHMCTTRSLIRFDWLTAAANLLHLAMVALAPFASAVLGEHLSGNVAFQTYSVVMMLIAFSGGLLWLVVMRGGGRLVGRRVAFRHMAAGVLRTTAIGWCFLAGFVLAGMGEFYPARFCWVLMPILMGLARLIGGKERPHEPAAAS